MERSWYTRLFLVLGLMVLALYYAAPSIIYFNAEPDVRRTKKQIDKLIPESLPKKRFSLGIDLQGGLHLVMGVDTDKAVQDRADRVAVELMDAMKEKDKKLKRAFRPGDVPELTLEMNSADDWDALRTILEERGDTWKVLSRSGAEVVYGMDPATETKQRDDAVRQAITTLRNRIDKFGVTEPEVRRRGDNSIMIQIAGLSAEDKKLVKEEIIGKTAQLEFKLVDEKGDYFTKIAAAADKPDSITLQQDVYEGPDGAQIIRPLLETKDKDALRKFLADHKKTLPDDRVVGIQEFQPTEQADKVYRTWLLEKRTHLTGDYLTNAFESFDREQNQWAVSMTFDRKGADLFGKLTRENVKRKMAIVLDEVVDSAPIIQGPIPNGRAQITLGGFKSQAEQLADAQSLAIVLKAGALPAPVYPQEERTVGATLGDDAIAKGRLALTAALAAVILLIIIYYKLSGAVGIVALGVNMLFLFATLAAFEATLTLPGIAGLVLTIGMAVDANIIQFERIREELRSGKNVRAAVDAGFGNAFSAIFDANVTTLLAAIVLFQFGSGPIRGFATTLGIGVFINTFTAVVVPRLGLDYITRKLRVKELSI